MTAFPRGLSGCVEPELIETRRLPYASPRAPNRRSTARARLPCIVTGGKAASQRRRQEAVSRNISRSLPHVSLSSRLRVNPDFGAKRRPAEHEVGGVER